MAFSSKQLRALKAKLSHRHVKNRLSNGTNIAYVEGWHVIAEANRIFGFENWDRRTIQPRCLWSEVKQGNTVCFYSTRVRILVRAGDVTIAREGIGTGIGRALQADIAHEIALKAAETDATKRALATFGNPFGLALYDKKQDGVTKPKKNPGEVSKRQFASRDVGAPPTPLKDSRFSLRDPTGETRVLPNGQDYLVAIQDIAGDLHSVTDVYRFWEENRANFSPLTEDPETRDLAAQLIANLKERVRALGSNVVPDPTREAQPSPKHSSNLLIPKEQRLKDKAHLEFVRTKPCLICGRSPAHAHHLRFAQKRAMGMKVSDEFTVPLCSIHHDEVHRTGDERAWWARAGIIEPLKVAEKLWAQSRGFLKEETRDQMRGEARPNEPPS